MSGLLITYNKFKINIYYIIFIVFPAAILVCIEYGYWVSRLPILNVRCDNYYLQLTDNFRPVVIIWFYETSPTVSQ